MVAHEKRNSAQLFCAVPTQNDFALSSLLFSAHPTQKLGYPNNRHLPLEIFAEVSRFQNHIHIIKSLLIMAYTPCRSFMLVPFSRKALVGAYKCLLLCKLPIF